MRTSETLPSKDHVGKKFGLLTILRLARPVPHKAWDKRYAKLRYAKPARFFCKCDCGRSCITTRSDLYISISKGYEPSCGCVWKNLLYGSHIGKRRGKLTILRLAKPIREVAYGRELMRSRYLCKCECGKEIILDRRVLGLGSSPKWWQKSCGCISFRENAVDPKKSTRTALFNFLRGSAKARGIQFKLSKEKAISLTSLPCTYCGVLPKTRFSAFERCNGKRKSSRHYPSWRSKAWIKYNGIDRRDPKKGYVPGNVVPCCKICNYAKHTLTYRQFKAWIKRVVKHMSVA